jgi:hypothetical protein
LITKYPYTIPLGNGFQVKLRPLLKEDEEALKTYFQDLPLEDRLCLKEDVTDPKIIENWIYNIDYDHVLPLVALDQEHIVGDATLVGKPYYL